MAESIGTVSKIIGVAYARAENGTLRELRLGDDVYEGEVLVTAGGSVVEVTVPDAPAIVLPGDRELLLSNEVILGGNTAEESMIEEDSLTALIAALESGENDILARLEATAAGIGTGGGSFIRLGRIGFGLPELQDVNNAATEANLTVDIAQSVFDPDLLLAVEATASITLDADITADDIIDATEAGQTIAIGGSTGGDVAEGDTVTLTINGQTYTGPVDGDGRFSIDVAGADLAADADATIEASVTTSTGNVNGEATATDTEDYGVDTTIVTASITLDADITADDIIDATEAGQTIAIGGSTGGDVAEGDTVTLTINGQTYTGPVDGDGRFSIDVAGADLAADADATIEASVTTSTGSINGEATATDTEDYGVDTTIVTASITLDADITADDIIDAAEAGQTIAIGGSTGGDVAEGDTVTLTINGQTYTGPVDGDGRFSIDVAGADLAADADATIEASVTTSTGSVNGEATATDTEDYGVDTTIVTASITLDADITADDIIDAAEAGQTIAIGGSTGGDVAEGDTVTLTINGQTYTGPVDGDGRFSIDVAGADLAADADATIEASVTTSTGSINGEATATDTEDYGVDTTIVTASITLDADITADDIIDAAEAGQTIAIGGSTGGDVAEGDTVTLTINGQTYTGPVDGDGRFSIDVAGADLAADADATIEASVTTSTGSINGEATATDTEDYGVDTTIVTASITLDADITADDIIDAAEAGQTIAIGGSTGGDVAEGDTVTLTINGQTYTGPVDGDGRFSIDVAGADLAADADATIEASVTTSTGSINGEATATDTEDYGVDTTIVTASITLDADITADDIIDAAEAGQTIAIGGSTGGDVAEGDTVTLTINGQTYTGPVDGDGRFSIDVAGADLAADADATIEASVTTSTGSINGEATATDTEDYGVNTLISSISGDIVINESDIVENGEATDTATVIASGGSGIYTFAFAPDVKARLEAGGFSIDGKTGVVTFTQTTAYSHALGSDYADNVYSIDVVVTDSNGSTVTQRVDVDIVDDLPEAGDFADLSVSYSVGATASGENSSYQPGADQLASVVINVNGTPQSGVTYSETVRSADGVWTMTASAGGNELYSVTFNENTGAYGFNLQSTEVGTETFTFTGGQAAAGPSGSYEITDDENNIVVTISGTGGDVNASNQGIGVAGNNLDPEESLTFSYTPLITNVELEYFTASSDMTVDITLSNSATGETQTFSDVSLPKSTGGSNSIIQLPDASFAFNTVTIADVNGNGSNSIKVNGLSADVTTTLDSDPLTFDVTVIDSDGDESSDTFVVTFTDAPISIDLDNDGVEYLSRDAGVVFTDEGTGESVNTAWVAPDDGMLVIDVDDSGTVNASKEYVFTEWSETAQTDLEAVAEVFDTNQDGVLDAQDDQWDQFAVWQDIDSDGITDDGELTSLTDLGIESIALNYANDSESGTAADGDVVIHGQSEVIFTDGSTTTAEDISFAISAADVISDDAELALPDSEQPIASPEAVDGDGADGSTNDFEATMIEADLMINVGKDSEFDDSSNQ